MPVNATWLSKTVSFKYIYPVLSDINLKSSMICIAAKTTTKNYSRFVMLYDHVVAVFWNTMEDRVLRYIGNIVGVVYHLTNCSMMCKKYNVCMSPCKEALMAA